MTIILHVVICIRFICIETYVPTPLNFGCNDPSIHEAYLTREYHAGNTRRIAATWMVGTRDRYPPRVPYLAAHFCGRLFLSS
jgi:hypothetical protein